MDEAGFTGDLTAGFKETITHKTLIGCMLKEVRVEEALSVWTTV